MTLKDNDKNFINMNEKDELITNLKNSLKKSEDEIKKKDDELNLLLQTISDKDLQLAEFHERITDRNSKILELSKQKELLMEVATKNEENILNKKIEQLTKENTENKKNINELQSQNHNKDEKIEQLTKEITENKKLNEQNPKLKENTAKELEIERLHEDLLDKQNQIISLSEKNKFLKFSLDEQLNNINTLNEELEILKSIIKEKDEIINLLNKKDEV